MNRKRRGSRGSTSRMRKAGAGLLAVILAMALGIGLLPQSSAQVYAEERLSDANTTTAYTDSLGENISTRYAGRVWTDKTVYTGNATFTGDIGDAGTIENDSDFLVAYSALATSQSVTGQTQVPVDVVFVIDLSTTMKDSDSEMSDGRSRIANVVEALNTNIRELMEQNENNRVAVVGYSNTATVLLDLDHYTGDGAYFTLNSENATGDSIYLSYQATGTSGSTDSRIQVTGNTNTQAGIYAGMNLLATVENTTVDINGKSIQRVPSVVLLSDGASNRSTSGDWWKAGNDMWSMTVSGSSSYGSSTWPGSALKMMMTASYMKSEINRRYQATEAAYQTRFYTIGMGINDLSDNQLYVAQTSLNPSEHWEDNNEIANAMRETWTAYANNQTATTRLNAPAWGGVYTFTHPDTGYDIDSVADYVDYYYDADDADQVASVFEDILSNITMSTPSVPTEIEGNDPTQGGYITYTDPIGKYMEVKEVKAMLYGGTRFNEPVKGTDAAGNTTYTFSGTIESEVYGNRDASEIEITLTEAADGMQTLTVRIPASAIPLRVNTITLDPDGNVENNSNNNAYPVRILYTVGLKAGVVDENSVVTDLVDETYVTANSNSDGTVNFYSNLYSGNREDGQSVGDATVEFKAASTNQFYFFQEDTLLYTNEECTEIATEFNAGDTYYLKQQYYNGNTVEEVVLERAGAMLDTYTEVIDGQLYVKAGSPRIGNLAEFTGAKTNPQSGTATNYYVPTFDYDTDEEDVSEGHFTVYLGNNGVLCAEGTGSLSVSKAVTADTGLTAPDAEFTFTVVLEDSTGNALAGTYDYTVTDSDGNTVTEASGTIRNGGTLTLKDGQTALITGLPYGTSYTVRETDLPGGFTATAPTGGTAAGTITAGNTASAAFTNNYSITTLVVLEGSAYLKAAKVLTGRDWSTDDSFHFEISSTTATDPLPTASIITIDSTDDETNYQSAFGNITFNAPGRYTYTIVEKTPDTDNQLPGMHYSDAAYNVLVEVADNGDGTLSIESCKIYYTSDDYGNNFADDDIEEVNIATFTNNYDEENAEISLLAAKVLTGNKDVENTTFSFQMEAVGQNVASAPMPAGSTGGEITVTNIGSSISFTTMSFSGVHVGNTYTYEISEVIPENATENEDGTFTYQGITYDSTVYSVDVAVTSQQGTDSVTGDPVEIVVATPTYYVKNTNGTRTEAENAVFTNAYEAESVTLSEDDNTAIHGQKTLNGRDMKTDEAFEFTLEAGNEATSQAVTSGAVVIEAGGDKVSVTDGEDGVAKDFAFGDVTFTEAGTYTFSVKETEGTAGGVAYDNHTCTVTVVVTDDGSGQLQANVTYNNGTGVQEHTQAVFTNIYRAVFDTNTAVTVGGTKKLTGAALGAGEFFFTVEANGAPMGGSNTNNPNAAGTDNGDGSYSGSINLLNNITYTAEGAYTYLIRESIPSTPRAGMTYDTSIYRVTVTVTDNQEGDLQASSVIEKSTDNGTTYATADTIEFNNTYAPTAGTYTPASLTKVLNGKDLVADAYEFSMTLTSGDASGITLPSNAKNDADGRVQFDSIQFTKAGDYTVTIQEVVPTDNSVGGVTYDSHTIIVRYHAEDRNGTLNVTRLGYSGSTTFVNSYTAEGTLSGADNLKVSKTLEGRQWQSGDTFTFTLEPAAATANAVADGKVTMGNSEISISESDSAKEKAFGDISFTEAGTYTFLIKEKQESIAGIAYDDSEYTVTVVATDNGDGTLNVSSAMTKDGAEVSTAEFTNTCEATGSLGGNAGVKIEAKKTLSGRSLTAEEFSFLVTDSSDRTAATGKNDADGVITFSEITYTTSGLKKDVEEGTAIKSTDPETGKDVYTYTYTVSEDTGALPDGVTAVADTFSITVAVTDNGDGTLSPSVTYPQGSAELNFINVYNAEAAELTITGQKLLGLKDSSLSLTQADIAGSYSFTITGVDEDGNEAPLPDITTVQNDEAGNVSFGTIRYTMENVFGDDGTADAAAEEETADTEEKAPEETEEPLEETGEETEEPLEETEELSGETEEVEKEAAEGEKTEAPSEEIKEPSEETKEPEQETEESEEEANVPSEETEEPEKEADGTEETGLIGRIFRTVNIVSENPEEDTQKAENRVGAVRTKTFTYTVTESGTAAGVTNDPETTKTFTVTVTDDGKGSLSAVIGQGAAGPAFRFTNTYGVDSKTVSLTDSFVIRKDLTGRTMQAGEFTFELKDSQGNVVSEGVNDENGNVSLSGVTFTTPGTYSYTLSEKNAGMRTDGVSYDSNLYAVAALVEDNGDGTLGVTWSVDSVTDGEEMTFENVYEAQAAEVSLGAYKSLKGAALKEGDFTFELKDAEGNVLCSASNDANGEVLFEKLTYEEEGAYSYTISEVQGDKEYVTYDSRIYHVTVNVTDDGKGYYEAVISYTDGEPVFENVYEKPEKPAPEDKDNGDDKEETPVEYYPAQSTQTAPTRTGDESAVWPWAVTALAAVAILGVLWKVKKGNRRS